MPICACSKLVPAGIQPASRATAKIIWKCRACSDPTTYIEGVAAELVHAVADGRQIGGRVVVAAVALPDDEGQRPALAAGETGREHAQRALVLDREALFLELGWTVSASMVVVEALAADIVVGQA